MFRVPKNYISSAQWVHGKIDLKGRNRIRNSSAFKSGAMFWCYRRLISKDSVFTAPPVPAPLYYELEHPIYLTDSSGEFFENLETAFEYCTI